MRILYLHQYFNTPAMTGGTRSYEMARRLVDRGHTVEMITSDISGRTTGSWYVTEEAGIRVHWLPVAYSNRMGFGSRIAAFLSFALGAGWRARKVGGDLVFATSTPLTIALPAFFASRLLGVPMVFEVRDLWPEAPIAMGALRNRLLIGIARWLERFAYRSSRRIVALSPGMQKGIENAGYPRERIRMIPNACDHGLFDGHGEESARFRASRSWLGNRPLVLYAGTLGKANGVGYLARLASEVKKLDSEIRFLVVGDGLEREAIEAEARRLGVWEENFRMLPPMPKSELTAVFRAADLSAVLFVDSPALQSCSPNKFFDSLAAGVPVLVNYGGWLVEIIRKSGCGLAVEPRDLEGAAHEVVRRLREPGWREKAGAAAKEVGLREFSRDRLARELEEVLVSSLGPG